MFSEIFSIASILGSFGIVIWMWRLAGLASYLKIFAAGIALVIGLKLAGVITLEVHPERVAEMVRFAWEVVP